MMSPDNCPKKRPPKEVMCRLVDNHDYQKKGKFSRVCKNCGKEVIDEDAINALIQSMEARINQLESELKGRIGVEPQTMPYSGPYYGGAGGTLGGGSGVGGYYTTTTTTAPTEKESEQALKDFYETYSSLKSSLKSKP